MKLLEIKWSCSQMIKMQLHNLKQHWEWNQTVNIVKREIFRSFKQINTVLNQCSLDSYPKLPQTLELYDDSIPSR